MRIFRFTAKLSRYYVAVAIASVLVAAANIAIPFVIGQATDQAVGAISGTVPTAAAIHTVILLAVAFFVLETASVIVSSIGGYYGDIMSQKMRSILSVRYFDKLLTLPQTYFDNELTGTITSRLNRSIMEVTNFVKSFANNFFATLLTVAAVLVISLIYSPVLALLLAIIFPVYTWLTALTSRRWQRLEGVKNVDIDTAGGRFNEVISQMRVVKSFTQEHRELVRFRKRYTHAERVTEDQSRHWHWMDFIRRIFMALIFLGIYAVIFVQTVRGAFSVGEMVLLIQLMNMARQPVQSMSYIVDTAQHAVAGSQDYFSVMALEPAPRPRVTSAPVKSDADVAIHFENVTFGYGDDEPVLHNISFDVATGERVALVSESGGGKTTITSLLLGFYPPTSGQIEIFGRDINTLSLERLRGEIGVVFQDASLFSGTIRENISYARPDATDEEIRHAVRRANADHFIRHFKDGYNTVIGERGLKLSGGQKQRISVARATLKDADILILDEATSALDTKAERQVQAGLDKLMEGRTSLIIAHRLSTIATVDRIITLRDGHIDEVGTPEELAHSGGIYAELLALQNEGSRAAKKRLRGYEIF